MHPFCTRPFCAVKALYFLAISFLAADAFEVRELWEYVDPRNATESPGNTVIGPQVPWGSINPSPDTRNGKSDGYTRTEPIRGFSQTHVHGTGGLSRYGNFLVSPQIGLEPDETAHESGKADEHVSCGRYAVTLTKYNIRVDITPTHHCAIYGFTFPASTEANICIDLSHYIPFDIMGHNYAGITAGAVEIIPFDQTIRGWGEFIGGWSGKAGWKPYRIYFVARFSKTATGFGTWKDNTINEGAPKASVDGKNEKTGAFYTFSTTENDVIYMKIAVSMTSMERAAEYLAAEVPGFDFDTVLAQCRAQWNRALSAVLIDDPTADHDRLTIFYTNLYHSLVMPRNRTGDCPWGAIAPYWDDQYTGWDTFRTLFPLYSLLYEGVVRDNVRSFITRFAQSGSYVGDAFMAGNTYGAQGGDNNDVVMCEAYLKGINGIDWRKAYEILRFHATRARQTNYLQNDNGWVNTDISDARAASRTLEFNYNDACVAKVAEGLGKTADYQRFRERSARWMYLWNPEVCDDGYCGFVNGRSSVGNFVVLKPDEREGWGSQFYEGTAWQYSFYVPHAIQEMTAKMGGTAGFIDRLKYYFTSGKHSWANEPTFLTARLFNYAARPDLTASVVRRGMAEWTKTGSPGNDDSGAMGSFYVFSALGFFPVAGQNIYLVNGPLFKKTILQLENGNTVTIQGENAYSKNPYIQSATLNDSTLDRTWFRHEEIAGGARFAFVMGPNPSAWGTGSPPPPSIWDQYPSLSISGIRPRIHCPVPAANTAAGQRGSRILYSLLGRRLHTGGRLETARRPRTAPGIYIEAGNKDLTPRFFR